MKKIQGHAKNPGRRINMKFSQVMIAPPVPAHESAWERGLRQAKEMRRRSSKRRETDVEYEEKKASLSLTQVGHLTLKENHEYLIMKTTTGGAGQRE